MSAATAWAYQPPYRPAGYTDQCYYRVDHSLLGSHEMAKGLMLFRFVRDAGAQIKLSRRVGMDSISIEQTLDVAELRALHAAIADALHDIAAVEADRELQESFDRISEEMRDADDNGGPRAYYAHPDIHYVPADQVEAKVRELEASGCKRYMVLAEPDSGNVVDASLEGVAA